MGWTSFHRSLSVKETMVVELASPNWRIIDAAIVKRNEYYAAIECVTATPHNKVGDVVAIVCLLKYMPRSEFNFAYKDMSESMGPCANNCPTRILDKLTATDSKYANDWRAACRAQQAKPLPKAGQTVTFAAPINFNNGTVLDTFKYVKGSRFINGFCTYRITSWKDRDYTVAA